MESFQLSAISGQLLAISFSLFAFRFSLSAFKDQSSVANFVFAPGIMGEHKVRPYILISLLIYSMKFIDKEKGIQFSFG
jgi:hypothetical protein